MNRTKNSLLWLSSLLPHPPTPCIGWIDCIDWIDGIDWIDWIDWFDWIDWCGGWTDRSVSMVLSRVLCLDELHWLNWLIWLIDDMVPLSVSWLKMVENGEKWLKMIENDEKWNDWKWLKMVENDWKMIESDETWNDCMVPSRVSCLWLEVGRHYKIRTQVSPVLEWAATIRYEEGLSSLCSGIKVGRHYKIRRAFPCLWGWLDSGDPPLQKGVWLIWWPQPLGCWWMMPCMI